MSRTWKAVIAASALTIVLGTGIAMAHARQSDPNRLVTVNFESASIDEVLAWVSKEEPGAVISREKADPSAHITLHMANTPIKDVEDAIAGKMGGNWERKGDKLSFKKSASEQCDFAMDSELSDKIAKVIPAALDIAATAIQDSAKQTDPEARKKLEADLEKKARELEKEFGPEFQKKFEGQGADFEKAFGPEFQAEIAKMAADIQKSFGPEFEAKIEKLAKEWHGKEWNDKDFQKSFGPEFKKQIAEMTAEIQKSFGPEFQAKLQKQLADAKLQEHVAIMQSTMSKEMAEKLAKQMKDLKKQFGPEFRAKLKAEMDAAHAKMHVDMQKHMAAMHEHVAKVKKLMKSLTPEQKELMKKNGQLNWSDLTQEQMDLLGNPGKGSHLEYNSGGERVVIVNL